MQDQNENEADNINPEIDSLPEVSDEVSSDAPAEEPVPNIAGPSVEALIDNSPESLPENVSDSDMTIRKIANILSESRNILIALSADPSVDDLSTAIGLSLCLEGAGKRATAIYSGATPNVLEFLKPGDTFESSTSMLQDFVIALDKEKADHLRYKIDGDYVKIYITPYRTRLSEEDLEFSYGSFNIDLVIGLNIKNGTDLDSALREHGRVMHSATVINITTETPGKFGEVEWSDPDASSISEMAAKLMYGMGDEISIKKDEATAFLTGIAATNRFSDKNTTPETMQIAARLMASGADQKLITENISSDSQISPMNLGSNDNSEKGAEENKDELINIEHTEEPAPEPVPEPQEEPKPLVEEPALAPAPEPEPESEPTPEPTESTPSDSNIFSASQEPVSEFVMPDVDALPKVVAPSPSASSAPAPTSEPTTENTPGLTSSMPTVEPKDSKTLTPNTDFAAGLEDGNNKYGQMLEDALNELNATDDTTAATTTVTPEMSAPALGESITPEPIAEPITETPVATPTNPAASIAPSITPNPEINGVPEINYNMPMPGDELLPPPPAPPIDGMGALPPTPEATTPAPTSMPTPVTPAPEPAAPAAAPAPTDPAAFKIP